MDDVVATLSINHCHLSRSSAALMHLTKIEWVAFLIRSDHASGKFSSTVLFYFLSCITKNFRSTIWITWRNNITHVPPRLEIIVFTCRSRLILMHTSMWQSRVCEALSSNTTPWRGLSVCFPLIHHLTVHISSSNRL